jgi:hypothetical protein
MKKTLYNAFIGGIIGVATGMAILTTLPNKKHEIELEETQAQFYQMGLKQGREEATSNLVSELNIATSNSLKNLHFRIRGIINDESLGGYQKIAIAGAYMQSINHLEDIQRIFSFYGPNLATGKMKVEKLQKNRLEAYGGKDPANYDYSKWEPIESK